MIRTRWSLLALGLLAACRGSRDSPEQGGESGAVDVGTAPALVQPFAYEVTAIGVVAPRPGRFATLAAPGPTRIAGIYVAPGQRVARGDSLVGFERAPFDAAARSAAAALDNAQRAYDRAVRLVREGILPQKETEQAAAQLAEAQAVAVSAQRAQELATLRAPLAGVVTRLDAVLGATVDPSQTIVEVADLSALDVVFNVSAAEAARIATGNTARFVAGEDPNGAPLGDGVVAAVGAAVDSASRTVAVRARIGRPARTVRIGEAIAGRILTAVVPRAVTVPLVALVPLGDGYQVFVVDSAGIAHARPVTVGGRSETLALITAGLAGGEIVVTTGAYGIEEGVRIARDTP